MWQPGRDRRLLRALAVILATGVLGTVVPPAGAARRSAEDVAPGPIDLSEARAALDTARSRAQAAAEEYERAFEDLRLVEERIAEVEAQLPGLRDDVDEARRVLAERAAAAYVGASNGGELLAARILEADDVLEAARVTRLAASANRRAELDARQLEAMIEALEARQRELEEQRNRQESLVAKLAHKTAEFDQAMADAAARYRQLEQEEAQRAWLAAIAAAQPPPEAGAAPTTAPPPPPPPKPAKSPPRADPDLAALVPVEDLVCPVAGPVTFSNDWGQPRSDGRIHQGTDIFAPRGTPNVAVADGIVRKSLNRLGGNAAWVEADEGTQYYYAHFDGYEGTFDGPRESRRVRKGDVIGYSGNTGNAQGGPVHTHFEVHPGGGDAVNPYRMLLVMCAKEAGLEPEPPG